MMMADEKRDSQRSGAPNSRLTDFAVVATLVGVVVMLAVSIMNKRELQRLTIRLTQLEALAAAPSPQGSILSKVYDVDAATAPAKGPATAPVTVAFFSEFQCPFCQRATATLDQIEKRYQNRVRFVWKHLPLVGVHSHAMAAAIAAEAARNQGRFWEYHDKLFANQERLEANDLRRYAQDLGLDLVRFDKDRADQALMTKVQADMAEATTLGVRSTPTFFINGRLVSGAMPLETFSTIIDDELAKQSTRASRSDASSTQATIRR
jgi:protein-disulfide isomerase